MRSLFFRVSPCNRRPGFTQPETKLAEQALTLPHAQFDPVLSFDPCRKRLAVPEITAQANVARHPPQHRVNLLQLLFLQPPWPSRALPLDQSGQATLFESMHPVLDSARRIP